MIYDWVSISFKNRSVYDIIDLLGLGYEGIVWETTKGAFGYRDRLYWEKISIHFNGREDMGILLEMSGQGCRAFESFGHGDFGVLFDVVFQDPDNVHLTRLDVAFDDHEGLLDITQLCADSREGEFISKFRSGNVTYGLIDDPGKSALFGSRSSEILIRIYDKAAERGYTDGRHWVRVELQLRRDRALAFLQDQSDLGERFCGVLRNYLRFIEAPDGDDTNRWRWPMKSYWEQLLNGVSRIVLFTKPGAEYNMLNVENFVFRQAGGAIYTYLECFGIEEFIDRLIHRGVPLNAKYKSLLAQYGHSWHNSHNFEREGVIDTDH